MKGILVPAGDQPRPANSAAHRYPPRPERPLFRAHGREDPQILFTRTTRPPTTLKPPGYARDWLRGATPPSDPGIYFQQGQWIGMVVITFVHRIAARLVQLL